MQTKERPTARLNVRDWERRDLLSAAAAVLVVILLIWTLAMLASNGRAINDLKNMSGQQQTQINSLESQISDNERKREQDTSLMLRYNGSNTSSTPGSSNTPKQGTSFGAPSTDLNGQPQTGGNGTPSSPATGGY